MLIRNKEVVETHDTCIISSKQLREEHDKLLATHNELVVKHDEVVVLNKSLVSSNKKLKLDYANLNMKLFQMDVKSAFLNGFINELVFVEQPPDFEDPRYPNHVYRLHKVL